jgi:hypothetical protein
VNRNLTILAWITLAILTLFIAWRVFTCGSSQHPPSCLALWGDFTSGVGTLFAVGVAVWAGLQWRVQRRTEFEERWAFELIDKLRRVESAFQWRRRRRIYEGETSDAKQREINDALREFLLSARPLEDIWGDPFIANVVDLERQIVHLEVNVRNLAQEQARLEADRKIIASDNSARHRQFSESRLDQAAAVALESLLLTDPDPTRENFERAANLIRKELLQKLRHLGRISN